MSSGEGWIGREGWMCWECVMCWECCVFRAAVAVPDYRIWAACLGKAFPLILGTGLICLQGMPGPWISQDWQQQPGREAKAQAELELLQGNLCCLPWQRCLTNPSRNLGCGKPSPCKHGPDKFPGCASCSSLAIPQLRKEVGAAGTRDEG